MSITPGTDGWVEWTGGENPVPGARVVAELRCGHGMQEAASEDLAWGHPAFELEPNGDGDIIAYHVVTPPVSPSPSDLDGAVERTAAFINKARGLLRQEGSTLDPADLRTILQALSDAQSESQNLHGDLEAVAFALGSGSEFLDPPDGGDVSLGEQVRRMRAALSEAQEQARLDGECLDQAHKAMAEYYRYWTGGEMRGSFDGKPERDGLWKALWSARARLATRKGETA